VLAKVFLVLDGEWEDVAAVDAREGDVGGHAEKLAQNTLRGNATKTKPSILSCRLWRRQFSICSLPSCGSSEMRAWKNWAAEGGANHFFGAACPATIHAGLGNGD
jgi:hypothetical protein